MRTGCGPSDFISGQEREDKLVHIMKDKYYGHPNSKRATYDNDPRQCVWREPTEKTSTNFQAPLGVVLSSNTGVIEYNGDHFNRQLRGNLIHVKYKDALFWTLLNPDGLTVNPLTLPGIKLVGRDGLDVAQAPNGNLIEVRYVGNAIYVSRPVESPTAAIRVGTVFPTRGSVAGGTKLRVYGLNFGTNANVTIGGSLCPIVGLVTNTYFQCTVPGRPVGMYDVVVSAEAGTYTFQKGYRYITGR
jgi:IPT/TIG domain